MRPLQSYFTKLRLHCLCPIQNTRCYELIPSAFTLKSTQLSSCVSLSVLALLCTGGWLNSSPQTGEKSMLNVQVRCDGEKSIHRILSNLVEHNGRDPSNCRVEYTICCWCFRKKLMMIKTFKSSPVISLLWNHLRFQQSFSK